MCSTKKNQHSLTLTESEMRNYGYHIVDTLVDHFKNLESKMPVALGTRKEMDALLREDIPEKGEDAMQVINHVIHDVLVNNDLFSHPKSFAFVPSPSNYISVLADTLASGFNIFSGGWSASPAASELEIITINWLLQIFHFPIKKGGGLFTSGGSMANLTALLAARRHKCGNDFSKAIIYLSDQAHSSNIKAIKIMGFNKSQVRLIPTDSEFRISLNKLSNAIARDRLEGLKPFCIVASAGTTNTGAVDPLDELSGICKREDLWLHVDGAYGAAAILTEKGARALKGIHKADSLTVDPHKWFFQPYDIGCLLVKKHQWLSAAFSEKPEYLRDIEGNESEINFHEHGVELTRRFRALKFYTSIKTFGLESFRMAIGHGIDLAEQVELHLRKSTEWEVISHANLAILNFRYNPFHLGLGETKLDQINQEIVKQITLSREAILATTVLHGQVVLRLCLINPRTEFSDVLHVIGLCENYARKFVEHHPDLPKDG